jgi:hypothetical protein
MVSRELHNGVSRISLVTAQFVGIFLVIEMEGQSPLGVCKHKSRVLFTIPHISDPFTPHFLLFYFSTHATLRRSALYIYDIILPDGRHSLSLIVDDLYYKSSDTSFYKPFLS